MSCNNAVNDADTRFERPCRLVPSLRRQPGRAHGAAGDRRANDHSPPLRRHAIGLVLADRSLVHGLRVDRRIGGKAAESGMDGLERGRRDHLDVTGWYAAILRDFVIPNAAAWSWAITLGELAVGIGLALGMFTGIAA